MVQACLWQMTNTTIKNFRMTHHNPICAQEHVSLRWILNLKWQLGMEPSTISGNNNWAQTSNMSNATYRSDIAKDVVITRKLSTITNLPFCNWPPFCNCILWAQIRPKSLNVFLIFFFLHFYFMIMIFWVFLDGWKAWSSMIHIAKRCFWAYRPLGWFNITDLIVNLFVELY